MPTAVCLIREKECTADTPHAAARAALCHEKSVDLKTFPGDLLAENALGDFIRAEGITYLLPVTKKASDLLANILIPAGATVLTHALHLFSSPHKTHEAKFIAYTNQNQHLHFLAPMPFSHSTSLVSIELHQTPPNPILSLAEKMNQRFKPVATWGFNPDNAMPTPINIVEATLLRQLGINPWLLPIFEANGHPVSITPPQIMEQLSRAKTGQAVLPITINRLYLDMDDTLYVHGKPNPHIINLLGKCTDVECPVSLITRHFQKPSITLADYNIPASLFDEILWITDGAPKSSYIKPGPHTFFIDDSFHEREEVRNTLNIQTFAPDIAEILRPKPNSLKRK